jgi:HEAT repeat protein
MSAEIAQMGARTPHELMRCAEVTFIRDCAELATRASLVRTESRWGLYHDRPDWPERDDAEWFWHLNVRQGANGRPEFLKRAVSPYLVPVSEFEFPAPAVTEIVLGSSSPGGGSSPGGDGRDPDARRPARGPEIAARPARVVELLRLAETETETSASGPQLAPYLRDVDPLVRRAAIAVLTETAPPGVGLVLAGAVGDTSGLVRHAAAAGLRELAVVLPARDPELRDALCRHLASPDPVVRCALLEVLRETGLADAAVFGAALADADHRVRLAAVRGLVAAREAAGVARAVADPAREVRIGVADGLAVLSADAAALPVLERLAADSDPLVRAAAFTAAAAAGCPPPFGALAARALAAGPAGDPAWQARAGAARALATAPPQVAITPLARAACDPHPDVRKAAVIALNPLREHQAAAAALRAATADSDADVRAYARSALA